MLGLRRLNTGRWNKPPVLTAAIALLFRRLLEVHSPVAFKDVAIIHNGQGLKASERDENGPFSVYASGGLVGHHSESLTNEPFVVIGRKGSAGKPTFAANGGWTTDTAYFAQPRTNDLDCKFLYYSLEACDFDDDIIATAIPGINRTAIYKHTSPIPDVAIQRLCVAFLDAVANGTSLPALPSSFAREHGTVAKIEKLVEKLEEANGLSQKSEAEVEALFCSNSRATLQELRESSKIVPIESVCTHVIDCLHSNPVYSENGIPTIRSPDVGWGTLLLQEARRTSEEEYERRTRRGAPLAGDIILVREGGGTGKAGIVEEGQKLSLGQRVMQLRPSLDQVLPRFLLYQWLSPLIQEDQIAAGMKGSASPHLNIGALRKFDFILPGLDIQHETVERLDDIQSKANDLKALQRKTQVEINALLPSILDRALKGEL